jgi:hypothetical protein
MPPWVCCRIPYLGSWNPSESVRIQLSTESVRIRNPFGRQLHPSTESRPNSPKIAQNRPKSPKIFQHSPKYRSLWIRLRSGHLPESARIRPNPTLHRIRPNPESATQIATQHIVYCCSQSLTPNPKTSKTLNPKPGHATHSALVLTMPPNTQCTAADHATQHSVYRCLTPHPTHSALVLTTSPKRTPHQCYWYHAGLDRWSAGASDVMSA